MAVFNILWSAPSISFTYFLRAPADWFTIKEPVQQLFGGLVWLFCQQINIIEYIIYTYYTSTDIKQK